jgi:hypothetical protein
MQVDPLPTGERATLFCKMKKRVRGFGSISYRAKALELLSLAESASDPERRADLLRFARHWMSLSEPMPNLPSAYEFPRAEAA